MYYNRILRIWVFDQLDCLLLSAILGSIVASRLKDYLSEKKARERLKNSIIKKLSPQSNKSITNSKKIKIKRIYKFALGYRGGQFEEFQVSNEVFQLAQAIKRLVERLARFLKERELNGFAKIFFKNGRLVLELLLYTCKIDMTSVAITEGLSTQVIIITATAGGAAGFTLSWFSAGAALVAPAVLVSILFVRTVFQQLINLRDYSEFKKLMNRMFENDGEQNQTLRAFFFEGDVPTATPIEMKPRGLDKNPIPAFNSNSEKIPTLEEFVKARMREELGLVENPTPEQLEKIIEVKKRTSAKTRYFRDFVKEISGDPDSIIDAEIIQKSINGKLKNQQL